MRSKKRLSTAVSVVLLGIVGVAFLFPFAWMVATSLKPTTEVFTFSPTGSEVAWENYPSALRSIPFGRVVLNSFIVSLSGAALVVVVSVLSAYAFARLRFKGRDHLFMLFLGTLVQEVLVIQLYIGMQRMGLVNSYFALIVPFAFGAFGAFLIRQFLLSLPLEFEEAARIDGCSDWRYLWKVMVPMSKPTIVAIALLKLINSWNSYMWPLIVTNTNEMRTLPVALAAFSTEAGVQYNTLMAFSLMIISPILLVYFFARKYIIRGVSSAGLKG